MQQQTRATAQKSSAQGNTSPVQKSYVSPSSAPSSPLALDTLGLTRDKARTDTAEYTEYAEGITERHASRKFRNRAQQWAMAQLKSDMAKAYWKSYHCGDTIRQKGRTVAERRENIAGRGNYITYYCGCRHCIICSTRRTVDLIRDYEGATDTFVYPVLGTFTVPAVRAERLRQTIRDMIVTFQRIMERFEKRYKRKQQSWKFRGIRVIECNYNHVSNTFNPHFHFLAENDALVEFQKTWLEEYASVGISPKAQSIEKADKGTMLELFKYVTKIAVQEEEDGEISVSVTSLDKIFSAFQGVRTVQTFGIKKAAKEQKEKKQYTEKELAEIEEDTIFWRWHYCDWYHHVTGEPLTGNHPNEKDINFVGVFE